MEITPRKPDYRTALEIHEPYLGEMTIDRLAYEFDSGKREVPAIIRDEAVAQAEAHRTAVN